jgi:tetratricopeptide (TPR) repeat protein
MMDLNTADQALLLARQQCNPDQLAEALLIHANVLAEALQLSQAQQEIDEAATINHQVGKAEDEAHCLQLAATVCRLQGKWAEAEKRATRSRYLATPNTAIALAAITELGEIALAQGNATVATDAFNHAIAEARALNQPTVTQAALLRKRAITWVISNRPQDSVQDAETASALLLQTGKTQTALRVLIEIATALQQQKETEAANHLRQKAMGAAEKANDHSALADLCLLEATQAIEQRNIVTAMTAAQAARTHALEAIAPLPYISAAVTISQLAEAMGDHLAAYEALAVGWVTVSDLLGREVARSMFEPKLLELRDRWGIEIFKDIKSTYEAQRRGKSDKN